MRLKERGRKVQALSALRGMSLWSIAAEKTSGSVKPALKA